MAKDRISRNTTQKFKINIQKWPYLKGVTFPKAPVLRFEYPWLVFRGVHQQIVDSFSFVQIFHASHVTCAIAKKYTNHPEKALLPKTPSLLVMLVLQLLTSLQGLPSLKLTNHFSKSPYFREIRGSRVGGKWTSRLVKNNFILPDTLW